MSMNGQFRQISPRAFDLLLQRPELVTAALDWELSTEPDPDDPLAGLPASSRAIFGCLPEELRGAAAAQYEAMLKQSPLAGLLAGDGGETEALKAAGIGDDDLPDALDIRKSWHGLHFLLTGSAWEAAEGAGQAVLGGREAGEDDDGYGPPRLMSPDEAAAVADALAALDEEALRARYAADAFNEASIYPRGWEDDPDHAEWMVATFREVRDYYADARRRGHGMILAIV